MLLGPTLSANNEGKKGDVIFNNKISTGAINEINPFFKGFIFKLNKNIQAPMVIFYDTVIHETKL